MSEENQIAPMMRYVSDTHSNIRSNLPEQYPQRIFAIIEDLDYPFEFTMHVPFGSENMYVNLNANDFFSYATAEFEVIAPEDMDLFEQTARELEKLEQDGLLKGKRDYPTLYLDQLFMARKRKQKPIPGRFGEKYIPKELHYLFEAVEEN